jgi:chemotaxis protein methyltransferase CheR
MSTADPRDSDSQALARLAEHIARHAGLAVPHWVLEARIRDRMAALGIDSRHAYADLVVSRPRGESQPGTHDELDLLVETLRVGETRFFRHAAHVEALIQAVIPALEQRGAAHVRAWSAGCASGEEAYTLAMVLSTLLPAPRFRISVLATDLSAHAIELARRGQYPASAIAHVPARWRRRGFVAHDSGYRIAPDIARLVRFERKNLLHGPYPGGFDIIWCRNVFIYFTDDARKQVLSRLLSSLSDEGVLFVGYSESLRGVAEIEAVRTPHAVIYRKARPTLVSATARPALPASPERSRAALPEHGAGQSVLRLSGVYRDGARLSVELGAAMSGALDRVIVDLDGAELLDDSLASVLRRARSAAMATGVEFVLRSQEPEILRWLRRHGLEPGPAGDKS